MSQLRYKRPLFFAAFATLALMLGVGLLANNAYARPGASAPAVPEARDGFVRFVPVGDAPPSGGTVPSGTKFTLELKLNTGTNPPPNGVTGAQNYLTFNPAVFQVITATSNCNSVQNSAALAVDSTTFDSVLQNEVCNGPNPCNFRGTMIGPGTISYASGALSNCPEGCDSGEFAIARITLCAVAGGQGEIVFQFSPPAPLTRDTQIVTRNGDLIQDRARFQSYTLTVTGATATPGPPTWTPEPPEPTVPAGQPTATPGGGGTDCTMRFSDVPQSNEFYEHIRDLYCRNPKVITGFSDSTFRPYSDTKRAQLAKMLVLAFNIPRDTAGGPHFSDVVQGTEAYDYVETAFNAGIITGFANRMFRPWDPVKRGQVAKMVVKAANMTVNTSGGPHFTDVPANNESYQFIETAFNRNLITGFENRIFKPYDYAKRGQISKIVDNALDAR